MCLVYNVSGRDNQDGGRKDSGWTYKASIENAPTSELNSVTLNVQALI